jgi:hypothetical protein
MQTDTEIHYAVPHVSMRVKDKYKVASSTYDRLLELGPLTDEAILQYAARGRYGEARMVAARAELQEREDRRLVRVREALEKEKATRKLEKQLSIYE